MKEIVVRAEGGRYHLKCSERMQTKDVIEILITMVAIILADGISGDVLPEEVEEAAKDCAEFVRNPVEGIVKMRLEERNHRKNGPLSEKERNFLWELMKKGGEDA